VAERVVITCNILTYLFDYAASELGWDSQYNPTKMFIDVCAFVGLVKDQKRALNAWSNLKENQMNGEYIVRNIGL
jgi:hypothetical protein